MLSDRKVLDLDARRLMRKQRAKELREKLASLKQELEPGMTLTNKGGDRWAMILADASLPGNFRYQLFDCKGFISHHVAPTIEKALEEAYSNGFVRLDEGALDRLAATPEWIRGMEIQFVRDQYNLGKLSWDDMILQVKQIDRKFSEAEAG